SEPGVGRVPQRAATIVIGGIRDQLAAARLAVAGPAPGELTQQGAAGHIVRDFETGSLLVARTELPVELNVQRGRARLGIAGAGVDDTAERVRAIGDGSGSAGDLDRSEGERVEITGGRSGASLGSDSPAVEQD